MATSSKETEEIVRLLEAWAAAVRSHDIVGIVRDRAEDVRLFDVVPPLQCRGLAAYRASWQDQFLPWMGTNGHFEVGDLEVTAGERVAFATGIIDCAGHEAGRRVGFRVRLTIGMEKRDGRWMVVHEHHSEPVESAGSPDRPMPRPREQTAVPLAEQLVAIERSLWTNDAAIYEHTLLPDAVLIFGETGRIGRTVALSAIRQENAEGRQWGEVRFDNVSARRLADETALLTYTVHARWEGDTRPIQAECTTVYVLADAEWRVVTHQQTTPTTEISSATASPRSHI